MFSVVEVAPKAFKDRKNLAYLTLENVTKLGKSSFQGCTKLKQADLGTALKSIGSKCFMGCKSLKTVKMSSKKLKSKKIGSSAFKKTSKKMTVKAPKSKLKAYKKAFRKAGASKKSKFKKL